MSVDIEKLRELRAQATPGPWTVWRDKFSIVVEGKGNSVADIVKPGDGGQPDADLIVAAVNELPKMLEEIETLRGDNRDVKVLIAEAHDGGRADERIRCAQIADKFADDGDWDEDTARCIAAAIRESA